MRIATPLALAIAAVASAGVAMAGRGWGTERDWVVDRAIEGGACAAAVRTSLVAPTPPGRRELLAAGPACRLRVLTMLRAAPGFTCRGGDRVVACVHPLNADDDTTYVRAVISPSHILLVTIPT